MAPETDLPPSQNGAEDCAEPRRLGGILRRAAEGALGRIHDATEDAAVLTGLNTRQIFKTRLKILKNVSDAAFAGIRHRALQEAAE
jgi:hypothetical protein